MDNDVQGSARYEAALRFWQNIVDFQANLAGRIEVSPGAPAQPAAARRKWQAGQPLFAGERLSIPPELFRQALADLGRVLPPEEPLRSALGRLLAGPLLAPANLPALLDDLQTDGQAGLNRLAEAAAVDAESAAFLLRTVLGPFFQRAAAPYQPLVRAAGWRHGICPICGAEPALARLAEPDGRRFLICGLCRTEWAFDRLGCPFCERDGRRSPSLRFFTVDGDEARRVVCCDRCRRYLKTVDERLTGRPADVPREMLLTVHLDALAREQGYRPWPASERKDDEDKNLSRIGAE